MKALYAGIGILAVLLVLFAILGFPKEESEITDNPTIMDGTFSLASPVFSHNGDLPSKYSCDGDIQLNPPLSISGIPDGTRSLALIVTDPDIPEVAKQNLNAEEFTHWVIFNISPDTTEIPEGFTGAVVGKNTTGKTEFASPCPPPEYEPSKHRYVFRLYALDTDLDLSQGSSREDVEQEMTGHILDSAELIGLYQRI
jgi:Raf kinase inhibitor-like YbhB/YbcL family protein